MNSTDHLAWASRRVADAVATSARRARLAAAAERFAPGLEPQHPDARHRAVVREAYHWGYAAAERVAYRRGWLQGAACGLTVAIIVVVAVQQVGGL